MKLLEAKGVEFVYPQSRQKIRYRFGPISMEVSRGEMIGVAGKNGVGKSTLLLLLAKILKPNGGEIKWASGDPQFGFCFQNVQKSLLSWKTVQENIDFAAVRKWNQFDQLMQSAGIHPGSFPYQLSGGQQQIVNLTRAFAMGRDAVFLDEPFSSLDYDNGLSFAQCLVRVRASLNGAVFLVAHTLELQLLLSDKLFILGGNPCEIKATWERSRPPLDGNEDFMACLSSARMDADALRKQYDEFI